MATIIEELSILTLVTLKVAGAKNVGKPIHIRRPWEEAAEKPMIGFGAFARQLKGLNRG